MRAVWCVVTLMIVAGCGCIEIPFLRDEIKTTVPSKRTQPVTAADVTAANAHEIAGELHEELERDALPPNSKSEARNPK